MYVVQRIRFHFPKLQRARCDTVGIGIKARMFRGLLLQEPCILLAPHGAEISPVIQHVQCEPAIGRLLCKRCGTVVWPRINF